MNESQQKFIHEYRVQGTGYFHRKWKWELCSDGSSFNFIQETIPLVWTNRKILIFCVHCGCASKSAVCIPLSQNYMELPLLKFPSRFHMGLGEVCYPSAAKHIYSILFLCDVYCWCLYYGHILSLWRGLQSCLAPRLFQHKIHFFFALSFSGAILWSCLAIAVWIFGFLKNNYVHFDFDIEFIEY